MGSAGSVVVINVVGFVFVIGVVIVIVVVLYGDIMSSDAEGTGMASISTNKVVNITRYFLGGTQA